MEDEMGGHVGHVVEMRNACKILVGKPKGKRIIERIVLR
jgi:hypothetical protein